MLKIALVGNIASGKSTVESLLKDKGFPVFDTDKIAHKILAESDEVKEKFKHYDIFTDGEIDRKKLAKIVFADKEELKKLEAVIHPLVRKELLNIFSMDYEVIFVSVPQLFEAGFESLFDKIILITADENIRLERLMKRNNITREEALLRINSQSPSSGKIKYCDFVIENNGTLKELALKIDSIIQF